MDSRKALTNIWPLLGLELKTPRLLLRLSDGSDLPELAKVARVIQRAGEPLYQQSWLYEPSPRMERELLQRYWQALGNWKPDDWQLGFVVYLDGKPIGKQDIWAQKFPVKRSITSGSWLGIDYQGRGFGTEMRAAVLELAFTKLGALEARTDYVEGNEPSAGVSRKLAYLDNGVALGVKKGRRFTKRLMRLTSEGWRNLAPKPQVTISGFDPCLELFELDKKES